MKTISSRAQACFWLCTLVVVIGCGGEGRVKDRDAGAADFASPTGSPTNEVPAPGFGEGGTVASCSGNQSTTIRGRVFDPAGRVPLYGIAVYAPSGALPQFTDGASCDRCETPVHAYASALTDEAGEFVLSGLPEVAQVTLALQAGKWLRTVKVSTKPCQDNTIPDRTGGDATLRLPRNQKEGHVPKIALVQGGCDGMICGFQRYGIDAAEFEAAPAPQGGRVHLYNYEEWSAASRGDSYFRLLGDIALMKSYDLIFLACWCRNARRDTTPALQPVLDAAGDRLVQYLDAGGRLFATHFHHAWFSGGPSTLKKLADWSRVDNADETLSASRIDTSFPKGKALAKWLSLQGRLLPSTTDRVTFGTFSDVGNVNADATRWVYTEPANDQLNKLSVLLFTANAPVGAKAAEQCGRAVFTDSHVASHLGQVASPTGGIAFDCAQNATGTEPSNDERALEFMFFDFASCIVPDSVAPKPPPVIK